MPKVAIFMGSKSDLDLVKPCARILSDLEIEHFMTISSAHRTPVRTKELVQEMESKGCRIFICAAGMAAHLAGAVAAQTIRPVIGIPLAASSLSGWDSLLATVQMPPGFPVATVALDKAGARNAAWMAAQILALEDDALAGKIRQAREKMARDVEESARDI